MGGSALLDGGASGRPWLWLALILLGSLPPLLIGLGGRDATHTMERVAVASSQETWFRQHGVHGLRQDPRAWLMPSLFGQPRVIKPPLVVWLNMLAWADLDPQTATPDTLILRARLVTVAIGLVFIAATYWAGMSLGGGSIAVVAALAVGSTWFFQRQARTASYDIHLAAWSALAVAAGLWAMRPFASPPAAVWRIVGWSLAGVAMGAAVFSKSPPLAAALVVVPLFVFILLARADRRINLLGLAWAVLFAAILVGPWFLYARTQVPELGEVILTEARAARDEFQPPWYYLGLFALVAPWTIWLLAGLVFPFLRTDGPPRRQLLCGWLWFVLIFVVFSIPGAKQQRYILPILPAFGIVVAQLWDYHQRLADRGDTDAGINLLRIPHWLALIVASAVVGPLLLVQDAMVAAQWWGMTELPIGPIAAEIASPVSILLVAIAVVGAWFHFREPWQPMRAAMTTGVWTLIIATLLWWPYSQAESGRHPLRARDGDVWLIQHHVPDNAPLYYLAQPGRDIRVDVALMLYAQRVVLPVPLDRLEAFTNRAGEQTFIVAPTDLGEAELTSLGWRPAVVLPETLNVAARLWVLQQ